MRKYLTLAAGLIASLALSTSSPAAEVKDLYSANVGVTSRDAPDRKAALKRALVNVLVKVSGDRNIVAKPGMVELLNDAAAYVQQYSYRDTGDEDIAHMLSIDFDRTALEQSLRDNNVPTWGRSRPTVLVWLAVEHPSRRYLVGANSDTRARKVMRRVAGQRGVPIIFPLLDLDDRGKVKLGDVTGGFDDTITAASRRYQPDTIVVAKTSALTEGFWRSQWRLLLSGEAVTWSSEGDSMGTSLSEGMHGLADTLAAQVSAPSTGPLGPALPQDMGGVILNVTGVKSLSDYARVDSYLSGLANVRSYRPYALAGDAVSFHLQLQGTAQDLQRAIDLGQTLERADPPAAVALARQSQILSFRLMQ
ncbi:MAG: DUF2066 domain-containing protein [Gammaproteobacteria bacterium]